MAQLSACNYVLEEGSGGYVAGREYVRLGLGVLKVHERVWGLARRALREVKGVAREMLATGGSGGGGSAGPVVATSSVASEEYSGMEFYEDGFRDAMLVQ